MRNDDSAILEVKKFVKIRKSLRTDLMDAIGKYRKLNEENALAQSKATIAGTIQALEYQFKADAADDYALIVDNVLKAHGL